jgi:hypothetical protein
VQRKRLLANLRSGWVWSPDTTNTLDEVKTGIGTLSQQLALVERMDRVYDRVTGGGDTLVPLSLHEAIHATLASVNGALLATSPTDGDLQAAETLLKDAEGRLSQLGQADAVLAPQIAGRIKTVRAQLTDALLAGADGTRVSTRLRAIMAPPLFKPEFEDAKNITPDLYLQLDATSCKLELVAKYLRLLGNLDEPSKRAAPLEREDRFLKYLELDGYAVFQLADRLLLEMRQGVYPEDIQARLPSGKEGTQPSTVPTIEVDQPTTYRNAPAQYRLVFHQKDLDTAVAREEFSYEWEFSPKDTTVGQSWFKRLSVLFWPPAFGALHAETGRSWSGSLHALVWPPVAGTKYTEASQSWNVWHFYPVTGLQELKLTIRREGVEAVTPLLKTIKVEDLPGSPWLKERTWVEAARTGVALLAPLLALVAGAREKLLQVDLMTAFIAIFLMGFTADAVKNLLVQGPPSDAGKPGA